MFYHTQMILSHVTPLFVWTQSIVPLHAKTMMSLRVIKGKWLSGVLEITTEFNTLMIYPSGF